MVNALTLRLCARQHVMNRVTLPGNRPQPARRKQQTKQGFQKKVSLTYKKWFLSSYASSKALHKCGICNMSGRNLYLVFAQRICTLLGMNKWCSVRIDALGSNRRFRKRWRRPQILKICEDDRWVRRELRPTKYMQKLYK